LRAIFASLGGQGPPPTMHRIPTRRNRYPPRYLSLFRRLSFELYPLNLQLWGAASMRDTFSRKFARRILKPRGKQDQYQRASQEEDTLPRVLWLATRSFLSSWLPSFSPSTPAGCGATTPLRKEEGSRGGLLPSGLPSAPLAERCVTARRIDGSYIGCVRG